MHATVQDHLMKLIVSRSKVPGLLSAALGTILDGNLTGLLNACACCFALLHKQVNMYAV